MHIAWFCIFYSSTTQSESDGHRKLAPPDPTILENDFVKFLCGTCNHLAEQLNDHKIELVTWEMIRAINRTGDSVADECSTG